MAVLVGVDAVHDSVPQLAVEAPKGFESLMDETNVPDAVKPVWIKTLKPASVETPPVNGMDQTVPLVAPETRVPPAYTSAPAVAVPLRVNAYVPGAGFTVGRITRAYC